jgi:hypothetical protein
MLFALPVVEASHPAPVRIHVLAALALQVAYDQLLHALPDWVPWALFAVALLLVVLGREGQRVLAGILLLCGVILAVRLGLAPHFPGSPLPAVAMIIAGAGALAVGLAWPSWGTAVALGGALGTAFALTSRWLASLYVSSLPWPWLAIPAALFGFFVALSRYERFSLLLPPLAAAVALTLGLSRRLGPHLAGAAVPQLAELPWVAALLFLTAGPFVALALAREKWLSGRRARRSVLINDDELKKQLALRRKQQAGRAGAEPDL